MREYPNKKCPSHDLIGSEHSCRMGKHPMECPDVKPWRDGSVVVDEHIMEGVDTPLPEIPRAPLSSLFWD